MTIQPPPSVPARAHPITLTGRPMTVAAFKRELRPGRRCTCVHRNQPLGTLLAGEQPLAVRTVRHVGSRDVQFTAPELKQGRSFFTYPTQKSGGSLEQTENGFILVYASGLRCVYMWLD